MRIGFARAIVVTAPQRRGPLPDRTVIPANTIMEVPPSVYDDLANAHPNQVLRLDPLPWCAALGILTQPQRMTMMRIIDCPRCYPPPAKPVFTRCRICDGATKVYTL